MFKVKRKHASITMEIVFAILLSLGVLFLALGLYSDNIKGMMDNGGLPNVFNRTSAKTDYQKWGIDPTRNQITAPEVEATSWEALLADYNNKAKTKIEEYYAQTKGGTVLLDDAQKLDLAMWLAVYANSSKVGSGRSILESSSIGGNSDYFKFGKSQDIDLTYLIIYKVIVNGHITFDWADTSPNPSAGLNISEPAKLRVQNIRDPGGILDIFN